MELEFCALASGSSGNSYVVRSSETTLLIDVGISRKRIMEGLAERCIDPDSLGGILITHEHSDHIRSLATLVKTKKDIPVYATKQTWHSIGEMVPEERRRVVDKKDSIDIGGITVESFPLSHDVPGPVGFTFRRSDKKIAIVTDTGCITEDIYESIKGADILVIEANHDVKTLLSCGYPYDVKRRILHDRGHLSNLSAADCICRILKEKDRSDGIKGPGHIILAHLSRENNTPDLARLEVTNALELNGIGYEGVIIDVVEHGGGSRIYTL